MTPPPFHSRPPLGKAAAVLEQVAGGRGSVGRLGRLADERARDLHDDAGQGVIPNSWEI